MGWFKMIRKGVRLLSKAEREIEAFEKKERKVWVRITHFAPTEGSLVLVTDGRIIAISTWTEGQFDGTGPAIPGDKIAFWRPLPKLPPRY